MNLRNQDHLADMDFGIFKRKVKAAYGLDLEAYKRPQMERRIRANMEKYGASTFQQYFALMQKDDKLAEDFLDRVTINVSELFRNPEQFDVLRSRVLPELMETRDNITTWSAGCSYGAEPYTVAVLLDEIAPKARHSVLATDIDDKILAKAQQGVFQEPDVRCVTKQRLFKYFEKKPEGYAAKNTLRKMITFQKHNLLESRFRLGFDLILCRNVVIYFTEETKWALYERFYNSLNHGGYLFVGGTERISNYAELGFENTFPFFYRKPFRN